MVAIGAYGNDGNGSDAGHVRLYAWDGSSWVQRGSDIDGEAADDIAALGLVIRGRLDGGDRGLWQRR